MIVNLDALRENVTPAREAELFDDLMESALSLGLLEGTAFKVTPKHEHHLWTTPTRTRPATTGTLLPKHAEPWCVSRSLTMA